MNLHNPTIPFAIPGLVLGAYPERKAPVSGQTSHLLWWLKTAVVPPQWMARAQEKIFLSGIAGLGEHFAAMTGPALQEEVVNLRSQLSQKALSEPLMIRAFALIRAVCALELGLSPFDTQLLAARAMLGNQLVEMATGEGKTMAAAVCAATAALTGTPVHVVTVNDYLVERDAHDMRPLFAALGLTTGHVLTADSPTTRRAAYLCDITYCTAKELVFDYLRDRVARGSQQSKLQAHAAHFESSSSAGHVPLLRGLCMAIVDEADSVLIDEARVPLILARSAVNSGETKHYSKSLELARALLPGEDFNLDGPRLAAELTAKARFKLDVLCAGLTGAWHNRSHREETVCTALAALHAYRRDHHYLVQDGQVHIIDEATGRLATGRVWSRGLHQLIELKESCKPTCEQVTVAQITYQRFFARYLRLTGMSGTLGESRAELGSVYGLNVVNVPLRLPSRRRLHPTGLFATRQALWAEVTRRAQHLSAHGQPVLIGTGSVADSESLSLNLTAVGLTHQVLNARHDRNEAGIVALAGEAGCVTVATNMAGRGTDIALGDGVAARGGLHVICCQHNSSRRIDRQLIGRCARQGDPGSAQTLIAAEQVLGAGRVPAWVAKALGQVGWFWPQWLVTLVLRLPQTLEERRQRAQRLVLQRHDALAERELFASVRGE